jgi:hypothetical protein
VTRKRDHEQTFNILDKRHKPECSKRGAQPNQVRYIHIKGSGEIGLARVRLLMRYAPRGGPCSDFILSAVRRCSRRATKPDHKRRLHRCYRMKRRGSVPRFRGGSPNGGPSNNGALGRLLLPWRIRTAVSPYFADGFAAASVTRWEGWAPRLEHSARGEPEVNQLERE